MSIKLRAWDRFNDEMIYSDKFDDIQDFLYDVKRRENGGNLVTLTGNRYADREWLEDEALGSLLDEASRELNRIDREFKADDCEPPSIKAAMQKVVDQSLAMAADVEPISFAKPKLATPKPARTESDYRDDFGHMIKEGDILAFTLCGRRFTGEVLKIFSPEAAKSSWQVWTYESPKLKLSLLHMCEDVACSKVRVIGHISTVRQGSKHYDDTYAEEDKPAVESIHGVEPKASEENGRHHTVMAREHDNRAGEKISANIGICGG